MAEDILDDALEDSSNTIEVKKRSFKKMFKRIFGYKKTILIIAASLSFLIIIIAGILLFFLKGSAKDVQNSMTSSNDSLPEAVWENEVVFEDVVDLEPFERIQLKANSAMGLISIQMSLELTDPQYKNQVYTTQDRIRKIITGQVEEMDWLLLRNPEGKILLKYALLKRINSIFPKPTVSNIYFTYFIMQ
ncbi:flagellar basal body-associated FliL family protein [Desulfobacula phenolica]|uniref:Flagellar protein FliL n=1 Tax=Desulfobacula phenolica TaxID=90732 RepID=A0A1H2DSM5_9BACT|nr:flagellar basal body-associated FliL family protein [Desulfobacula phenolica]SDT85872.1 flagellar FliL protein [Desulfobacula phenolica]